MTERLVSSLELADLCPCAGITPLAVGAGKDACGAAVRDCISVTSFQRLNLGLCRWYFPAVGVWHCYLPTVFHMWN